MSFLDSLNQRSGLNLKRKIVGEEKTQSFFRSHFFPYLLDSLFWLWEITFIHRHYFCRPDYLGLFGDVISPQLHVFTYHPAIPQDQRENPLGFLETCFQVFHFVECILSDDMGRIKLIHFVAQLFLSLGIGGQAVCEKGSGVS